MSCSPDEFSLKQMGNLLGTRRPKDGEQNLIQPPSEESAAGHAPITPRFVYVLAFFSALGGFLFGYDTGVVSGAMLPLKEEMNLNNLWQELLVSCTVGAAAVSSLGGGFLNGWLGRRICILIASFIFSIGGVILGLAPSKEVLLVGRVTVGLGIGELTSALPSSFQTEAMNPEEGFSSLKQSCLRHKTTRFFEVARWQRAKTTDGWNKFLLFFTAKRFLPAKPRVFSRESEGFSHLSISLSGLSNFSWGQRSPDLLFQHNWQL